MGTDGHSVRCQPKENHFTVQVGLLDDVSVRIDSCDLTEIPQEVFLKGGKLKELVLSRNFIQYIPPEICKLRCLKVLRLDRNQLTVLPPEIGRLGALQHLDLQGNQIDTLPVELGMCVELQVVNLLENPLQVGWQSEIC